MIAHRTCRHRTFRPSHFPHRIANFVLSLRSTPISLFAICDLRLRFSPGPTSCYSSFPLHCFSDYFLCISPKCLTFGFYTNSFFFRLSPLLLLFSLFRHCSSRPPKHFSTTTAQVYNRCILLRSQHREASSAAKRNSKDGFEGFKLVN